MSRLRILLSAMVLAFASIASAVQVIGHRGSLYGVENTREAYMQGVALGYWALECDVRTTRDGQFVLSHDTDLARLGQPGVVVADCDFDSLLSLTLTQTRAGRTYTGRLCSLSEYLDICVAYDKVPVIELKWATGVNSHDQSMMPALLALIADKGLIDRAIILTSMRPCLEWIRRESACPDMRLMWLCTPETEQGRMDWCRSLRLDIDIRRDFSDTIAPLYHAAGLRVGVWTVNNPSEFARLSPMVDYLTTDSLPIDFLTTNSVR